MATVQEIRDHYESEKTKLLTQTFDLRARAQGVDVTIDGAVRDKLSPGELSSIQAAEAANVVEEIRAGLKAQYVELELEQRAALEIRGEEIMSELAPEGASFADFEAAASAQPEALKVAYGMAQAARDERGVKIALFAGMERDLEDVVSHITTQREDLADLLAELSQIEREPEFPPDEAFEQFAEPAPSKQDILGSRPSDINQSAMIR